jgi:tRNA A-37 threonylcarbamoyl transferase component Bud32
MAETRVERVRAGDRDAWRKSYREGGRRGRLAARRGLARRMGTDALLPPGQQTPEQACLTEQAMIRRLAALGARVPEILESGPRHLLLSDLGPSLASRCRAEADPGRRERMLRLGLEAILRVHAQGGWLSQAFARNLTLDEAGIGFIDLAEDTRTVMSLASAQARDLLFYAHSTARFLADRPGMHAGMMAEALARSPEEVRAEVRLVARRLRWLAPLSRRFGGRAREVAVALDSLARASA